MADSVKTFLHDLVRVSLCVSGPPLRGLVSFALVTAGLPRGAPSFLRHQGQIKKFDRKGARGVF